MIHSARQLLDYKIVAKDESVGTLHDFLFDERTQKVRYLVVDIGRWLPGRRILVRPDSCWQPSFDDECIGVRLSAQELRDGPSLADDAPVSKQHERDLASHFMPTAFSRVGLGVATTAEGTVDVPIAEERGDPHLHSFREVRGYELTGSGEVLGELRDLLLDDVGWLLSHVVVDTSSWLEREHNVVLTATAISEFSYPDSTVASKLRRHHVSGAVAFDSKELPRDADEFAEILRHAEEAHLKEKGLGDVENDESPHFMRPEA